MSDVWYFSEGKERVGPLDLEALKATLETYDNAGDLLVWRPGFAAWRRASDVPEVATAVIRPPPLPLRDQSDGAARPTPGSETESATLPTNRRPRFNNFVARNWRGECPLWVSYWIFAVLGTLILGATLLAIDVTVLAKADYAPHAAFAALTGGWLVILAVAVWQLVGVWRSASRRIQERRQLGKHTFWATLAKVAVVLGVVELAVRFAVSGLPPIAQATRITFMGDPAVPPYAIRVMRNATEAEITGGFKHGLTDDFRRILEASPQIKVVHLDSLGGRIGEARKLNALIRERGLITYVASRCASACVVAFAGGRERWLRTEGELGFHGSTVPGLSDADFADRADRQREIFVTAGFDPRFVDRALATPSRDMWVPSADELLAAKVVTAVSDGTHFAASGYGAHLSRESMAAKLTEHLPILQALRERLPKDHAALIDVYYAAYTAGQTEVEMTTAARGKLVDIIIASRSLADDAVLVEWGRLLAEQYAALGAKDPSLCYVYASAERRRDVLAELSQELVDRQLALEERIIATAAPRPELTTAMLAPVRQKVQEQLAKREPLKMRLLLLLTPINASQHADYCDASIALLEVVTGLPENEAALFFRHIFGGK